MGGFEQEWALFIEYASGWLKTRENALENEQVLKTGENGGKWVKNG